MSLFAFILQCGLINKSETITTIHKSKKMQITPDQYMYYKVGNLLFFWSLFNKWLQARNHITSV